MAGGMVRGRAAADDRRRARETPADAAYSVRGAGARAPGRGDQPREALAAGQPAGDAVLRECESGFGNLFPGLTFTRLPSNNSLKEGRKPRERKRGNRSRAKRDPPLLLPPKPRR